MVNGKHWVVLAIVISLSVFTSEFSLSPAAITEANSYLYAVLPNRTTSTASPPSPAAITGDDSYIDAVLPNRTTSTASTVSSLQKVFINYTTFTKSSVSFSILQDHPSWPVNEQTTETAQRDFSLMRELGIRTWRGSFSWNDIQPNRPVPGDRPRYDFAWVRKFAELAEKNEIKLRPYLAYTPKWAEKECDHPAQLDCCYCAPRSLDDWRAFVHATVSELTPYRSISSYEIWNEEDIWKYWPQHAESRKEYNDILRVGSDTIRELGRKSNRRYDVLLGGIVYAGSDFISDTCQRYSNGTAFDILPIHGYPETFSGTPLEEYLDRWSGRYNWSHFTNFVNNLCTEKPIWINETGFATTSDKSEEDQARWFARAFATFLAAPGVQHLGIYQLRDRADGTIVGGQDIGNRYLGLTYFDADGTIVRKKGFYTVKMLVSLLDTGSTLTVADGDLRVTSDGGERKLFAHLFVRPDARQVLFVWDKEGSPVVNVKMRPGKKATEYRLNNTSVSYPSFDGEWVLNVKLSPGLVRIFEISP